MCAVHRVERPLEHLIRFVAGPSDILVADLKRNLPGRGVWITADKDSVVQAIRGKVFDRSLKKAVRAAPELPTEIEVLLKKRLGNALSLANKAGAAIAGFTKIELAIQKQELEVLVQAGDAATDGRDKLYRKFVATSPFCAPERRIVTILTTEQLSLAMGRSNVVHAGLVKSGMARSFLFEAKRLEQFIQGLPAGTVQEADHLRNE